jgi:hypothetical protein
MLSLPEFQSAAGRYSKRLAIAMSISVAGLFVWFGIMGLITRAQWIDRDAPFTPALVVVPALAIFLSGLWMSDRRLRRDSRLTCPHCGQFLGVARSIVVASRNCFHCGKRVLAEP